MAMLYYKNLNDIRERKTEALLSGDYYTACECLNEIFTAISFKLNENENKLLTELMSQIDIIVLYLNFTEGQEKSLRTAGLKTLIRTFDREALKLMNKYKMIFPRVQGSQGLSTLRDKYRV